MVGKKETKTNPKRRTQVKDLPAPEKELTTDELKQVQGGATRAVTPGIRTSSSGETPPVPPFCGI
jgi:bacteriocin-like protein